SRDQESLAKIYSRFQQALALSGALRRLQRAEMDDKAGIKAVRQELEVWNSYASESEGSLLAGSKPSLPDFVVFPALHTAVEKYGTELFEGLDNLGKYYGAYGDRETARKALGKQSQSE